MAVDVKPCLGDAADQRQREEYAKPVALYEKIGRPVEDQP